MCRKLMLFLSVGTALLAGCSDSDDDSGRAAMEDSGTSLDRGVRVDASAPDTGTVEDGGVPDASGVDGGAGDGGALDQGTGDAAAPDGSTGDAGVDDGGGGDAGSDVGPVEAGTDVGPDDGGPPDAGEASDGGAGDAAAEADGGGADASFDAGDAGLDAGSGDAQTADAGDAGVSPACNPTFGAANACGGLPFGTWSYRAACSNQVPLSSLLSMCPGATASNVTRTATGTLTLASTGAFSRTLSTTTSGRLFVPQFCVTALGQTCSTLPAYVAVAAPGTQGTCAATAGGCDCHVTVIERIMDSGTASASGGTVTTVSGGQTRSYWYCVQGSTLEYRGYPSNPTDNDTTYVLTP